MVKLVAETSAFTNLKELELLIGSPDLKNPRSDSFNLKDGDVKLKVEGSGFTYDSGFPTGGKITDVEIFVSDKLAYSLSDMNLKISDVLSFENVGQLVARIFKGNDELIGSTEGDVLSGHKGADVIKGKKGDDALLGQKGDDNIKGGNGADILDGGAGRDKLDGGRGIDKYVFTAAPGKGVDKIVDFQAGEQIALDDAVFNVGPTGVPLSPTAFVEGSKATTADHRIVYKESNGKIWHDDDGIGPTKKVLIAKVTPGTDLDAGDFFVF
ncbi:calcium-binding protein [Bauldia sp.]|uniref:calcium-binding protein n=1 Tax=Bauldia sp. TaxID=2575872 RepID=UPI003BA88C61